jgi:NAD/NADP transhydrogenase alpha subunit
MTLCKFPGPWQVEASDGAFIIRDANGFAVTYVYWKLQPALHDRYMTRAEAAMIAEAVAKLPELLERARF